LVSNIRIKKKLIIYFCVFVDKFKYAIVFDAGSSGSRMYIYEWKSGFSAAKGDPLVVKQKIACKTEGYFSAFKKFDLKILLIKYIEKTRD